MKKKGGLRKAIISKEVWRWSFQRARLPRRGKENLESLIFTRRNGKKTLLTTGLTLGKTALESTLSVQQQIVSNRPREIGAYKSRAKRDNSAIKCKRSEKYGASLETALVLHVQMFLAAWTLWYKIEAWVRFENILIFTIIDGVVSFIYSCRKLQAAKVGLKKKKRTQYICSFLQSKPLFVHASLFFLFYISSGREIKTITFVFSFASQSQKERSRCSPFAQLCVPQR